MLPAFVLLAYDLIRMFPLYFSDSTSHISVGNFNETTAGGFASPPWPIFGCAQLRISGIIQLDDDWHCWNRYFLACNYHNFPASTVNLSTGMYLYIWWATGSTMWRCCVERYSGPPGSTDHIVEYVQLFIETAGSRCPGIVSWLVFIIFCIINHVFKCFKPYSHYQIGQCRIFSPC